MRSSDEEKALNLISERNVMNQIHSATPRSGHSLADLAASEVEQAAASKSPNLYLCGYALTDFTIPPQIFLLDQLHWINLCDNRISKIPNQISLLSGIH